MEAPAPAPPAQADQLPTNGAATTTPQRRKRTRSTRIALVVILIVAVVAAAGFALSYFLDARNYVTTDNAQVDGNQIMITAPATGTLIDWTATQGTVVSQNQVVGRIEIQDGFAQPQMPIRAPGAGTIAVDNTVPGEFVNTGTQLAVAYDLDKIYVTARVDDTDIKAVHLGQLVDISVDGYPNARITGHVREIQAGAAAVFSLFPQSNTQGTGTFQKVTQVIPVKIGFDNLDALNNLDLVPGMNVTVHIHKN
ncbi:MAG: efflux RND transporter periplasmic adaptor subunit [Pseudonocardiaceae bacterium]